MNSVKRIQYWNDFININNESSSTISSCRQPREIILQSKGKEYEIHKQTLKKQHDQRQLLLSPFHPVVNSKFSSSER